MGQAQRAKLAGKDTYKEYPQRMLQMRARSFALRDTFTDALKGMCLAEEAQDIHPAATEPRSLKMAFERTAPATVVVAGEESPVFTVDAGQPNGTGAVKAEIVELAAKLAERGKADVVPGDWETYTESGMEDLRAFLEEELKTA
jgi:hypothetical protein